MQHVLSFKDGDIKYVSKPFDFEALCIINDVHLSKGAKGPLRICRDALDYMFEGTDATQEVIDAMDVGVRADLCMKLWGFYTEAISSKKE